MGNHRKRVLPSIGWYLLSGGMLLLFIYGTITFLSDSSETFWVRLGFSCIGLGLVSLFFYIARQRLIARKSDIYRDVSN